MDSKVVLPTERNNMLLGIDYLLDLNEEHSRIFTLPGNAEWRRQYRETHPTEIGVAKCMDGRLNGSVITKTPLGILQPWRNLGGKFDPGWPFFGTTIQEWRSYARKHGHNSLVLVTYHKSRGDIHRGCRGFNYDENAAIEYTLGIKRQFDYLYEGEKVLYTIQCGIETDLDALILHGEHGERIDLSEVKDSSQKALLVMLQELYPSMPERTMFDFLPLVIGNIRHIAEVKTAARPVGDVEHKEWVFAYGRGFDWLHLPNTALIVGPYDLDQAGTIQTAAGLLKENLDEGRIPEEQPIVLMTCAPYRDAAGPERRYAEAKARALSKFAAGVISERVPDLVSHLQYLVATVNTHTRKLDLLYRGGKPL